MSDFAYAVGGGSTVTLAGQTYVLSAVTLSDLGTIINKVAERKGYSLMVIAGQAAETVSPDIARMMIENATKQYTQIRDSISLPLIEAMMNSGDMDIVADFTWLSLLHKHPTVTRESIYHALASMPAEEVQKIVRALYVVSGYADPNSSAPQQGPKETTDVPTGDISLPN